jgi:hypothetical protein
MLRGGEEMFLIIVNVSGYPKWGREVNFLFPPWCDKLDALFSDDTEKLLD